jgi:Caspase domain
MSSTIKILIAVVGALLLMPLTTGAAWAQKRVALVVGNGAYQNVAKLPNPLKDANAITEMFRKAGFDWVKMRQDLGNLEFKRALREFMDAASDADVAVIYYAGHGIQVRDMNYMIPVDAKLATEIDAEDEAVSLDRIVMALEPAKRLRLVILDACRDNPFARNMKRRVAMRAVAGGLAKMEPTLGETLIAYAAKAGSTAEDGDGDNSPFAAALLKNLTVPGLDIRLAFGRVRDDVLRRTGNRQEPFVYGSLGGEAIALVPAPVQPKAELVKDVKGDYQLVERIGTKKAWEVFLSSHKEGLYADLARAQLAKLIDAERQPAAPIERAPTQLASVEPTTPPRPNEQPSEERRVWERIRDSGDRAKLRDFIAKYPSSPLAETAKNRLDSLDRAAHERDEKARLEREAAQRREDEAKRLKAEEAAREAARKAAEREAAQRREEEEKRLKAEEAARKLAEREAARQREEEAKRLKADEAARKLAEREAAQRREEEEKRVKAEEAARKLAEREAAQRREEEARRAKAADADRPRETDACSRDGEKLALLKPSLNQGWAREDLKRLERQTACDRVRSEVVALLAQPTPDIAREPATPQPAPAPQQPAPQAAPAPQQPAANTPQLIASAQSELRRLGCFAGQDDGKLGGPTTEAIKRYLSQKGRATNDVKVTVNLVADLKEEAARVCPLTCSRNERAEGDVCVAIPKPEKQAPQTTAKQRDEDAAAKREQARREQAKREQARREREEARREEFRREERRREAARPKPERARAERPAPAPQPAARSQAAAPAPVVTRPAGGGIVGVGF